MKRIFLLLLIIFPACLYSQDQLVLDSLLIKLQHAEEDSAKVTILIDLSKHYRKTDLSRSLDYSLDALEIAKETNDPLLIAISYYKKGSVYLMLGNYNRAQKDLLSGLKIFEEFNNKKFLFKSFHNLGVLNDRLGDFDRALDYYFEALSIYNESMTGEEPLKQAQIYVLYNNIANIYNGREENNTAMQYYKKGLELAKVKSDYAKQGVIYNNLGKLYLKLEEFDKAHENIEKSLEVRRRINDKGGMAKSYYFLAAYYMKIQKLDKALEFTRKSLVLGQEVGSLLTQKVGYKFLTEIYEEKRECEKALKAHKLYKEISDSLVNENTIRELTQVQMQHEFEKKEKIREAEKRQRELQYGLIISILTLGFVIIGFLYRLSKSHNKQVRLEKKNLENDLEFKNKELTTNVLYLIKKNEFINGISHRLLEFKAKLNQKNWESLQKIIFDLHSSIDQDTWVDFEIRFQQIHSDFYNNLQEKFPKLSPSERKLAAFLRLNMSSKEIASITGQSTRSLEVARHRLRKKLGIANKEVNLINFLCEL